MKQPQVGVAVLIEYKGKYLFSKRLSKHEHGKYGVPGGKVDFGETLEDAARREVFEETRLVLKSCKLMPLIANNVYNKEDMHFICFWYKGELDVFDDWDGKIDFIEMNAEGNPKSEGWQWFSPLECEELPLMRSTPYALNEFFIGNNNSISLVETTDKTGYKI